MFDSTFISKLGGRQQFTWPILPQFYKCNSLVSTCSSVRILHLSQLHSTWLCRSLNKKEKEKKISETSLHNHFLVTRTSGGLEINITPRNLHSEYGQSLKMHQLNSASVEEQSFVLLRQQCSHQPVISYCCENRCIKEDFVFIAISSPAWFRN